MWSALPVEPARSALRFRARRAMVWRREAAMPLFEFVLAFKSVIPALGIGHLLFGTLHMLRGAARVEFSLTQSLWMWSVFAMTLGNWAADWSLRSITEWPAWSLLLLIVSKIAQYVLCVFVTPDVPA